MTHLPTSPCKGCGKPVVWIEAPSADGKKTVRIPLDPRAPVYAILKGNPLRGLREPHSMVTHFATCPKASEF